LTDLGVSATPDDHTLVAGITGWRSCDIAPDGRTVVSADITFLTTGVFFVLLIFTTTITAMVRVFQAIAVTIMVSPAIAGI
jgi:hypothetical protein